MKAKNFETLAYVPQSKHGFGILILEAENTILDLLVFRRKLPIFSQDN